MTPVNANRTIPVADALSRFSRSWKSAALALAVGSIMLIVLPRVLDDFALVQATVYAVMAILALSLGFVWGFGGILCFGQSAFFGLGAYTYAIAVTNMGDSTVPFMLAIVLPAAFAAIASVDTSTSAATTTVFDNFMSAPSSLTAWSLT